MIQALNTEYRSTKEDLVIDFFQPCLKYSNSYKRAAGYFKSTVFNVIGTSIVEFSRNGGLTQIICSPELSDEDIESIILGYAQRSNVVEDRLSQQIDELLSTQSTEFNTRVLGTLVAVGSLEIKVAMRADSKGLYHEKLGVFSDNSNNNVSFMGSANETWRGWHPLGNIESIEVFCSWRGGLEAERVIKHKAHFENLWAEKDPNIEVFSFPTKAAKLLEKAAFKNLDELGNKQILKFKKQRVLLPHQKAAVDEWQLRGGMGIFEHATGSGKTFAALNIIRQHTKQGKPALVVVPSKLLLDQWKSEINNEIPEATLLLAGGGNTSWKSKYRLKGLTAVDQKLGSRIVLATMQTASTKQFLNNITSGEHLLLVADEVHQIGSNQYAKIMELKSGFRLGLSATPIRYGDQLGTSQIFKYFGGIVPPSFTLFDAIKADRLVPYEYFPHALELTKSESIQWRKYTMKICQEIGIQKQDEQGNRNLTKRAKYLLIQRSRIAKKAFNKIQIACEVLLNHFVKGQTWLVYCEDSEQLIQIMEELRKQGIESIEYHSNMVGDRNRTMDLFRTFGGILVTIRCLDEGIDIPVVSHALILASSQNPRQFIQRRGRVLRRSPHKHIAIIHDTIIVPEILSNEPEQTNLLKSELVRALEFARNAINKGCEAELIDISINLGINIEDLKIAGFEE